MFIQVIRGKVVDAEGFKRQHDRWKDELMGDAKGFVGSTSGITPDGRFITVARFESEELAQSNSDSDLQSQWWAETEKMVDDVTFTNLTNIVLSNDGGSDDAGFVQVMIGKVNDVAKAKALDDRMSQEMPNRRPDVIGSTTGYTDDGEFVSTIYFTSEKEAREGEKKMSESSDSAAMMAEWGAVMDGELTFFDLPEPDLVTK
jgi:hypothetical protein